MVKVEDITRGIYDSCNNIEEYKNQILERHYEMFEDVDSTLHNDDETLDFLTDIYDELFEYTNRIEEYFDLL